MSSPIWYAGACDSMLQKVQFWALNWARGEVYASDECWSIERGPYENVTMRIVKIPWTRVEVDHLLRILARIKPQWSMTANLKAAFANFDRCSLISGSLRVMAHASYESDPKELFQVLLDARDGKTGLAQEMEEVLKKPGTGPWWG